MAEAQPASIEERYIAFFNVGQDAYEYIGNPYLKPEVNNQFEIGFNGNKKLKGFANRVSYNASIFYSIFENYISAVVDTTETRKYNPTLDPKNPKVFTNISKAFKTGFELMGNLQFAGNYYFITELSYVYSENKDFNESLPLTPPLTTRLRWDTKRIYFGQGLDTPLHQVKTGYQRPLMKRPLRVTIYSTLKPGSGRYDH